MKAECIHMDDCHFDTSCSRSRIQTLCIRFAAHTRECCFEYCKAHRDTHVWASGEQRNNCTIKNQIQLFMKFSFNLCT